MRPFGKGTRFSWESVVVERIIVVVVELTGD